MIILKAKIIILCSLNNLKIKKIILTLIVYVDDIIVTIADADTDEIERLERILTKEFKN